MTKKLSKTDKLTLKQAKWLELYIETGNATDAAFKVYNCKDRNTASNIGSENLRKLRVDELMEEMGLTDVALINATADGLMNAKKVTSAGESFVETPDYGTRHRYLETALKLKKRLGADNTPQFVANNMQINVLDEGQNQLNE